MIAVSWEDTRWSHEAAKEAIGGPSRLPVRHGGAPTPTNRARATWLRPRQRGWVRGLLSDHGAGFTFLAGYRQRACYQGPKGWSSLVAGGSEPLAQLLPSHRRRKPTLPL